MRGLANATLKEKPETATVLALNFHAAIIDRRYLHYGIFNSLLIQLEYYTTATMKLTRRRHRVALLPPFTMLLVDDGGGGGGVEEEGKSEIRYYVL